MSAIPENASEAVLVKSVKMPADAPTVKGHDFQEAVKGTGPDYAALLSSYRSSGFQAMNFGLAVDEIKAMIKWRMSDDPVKETDGEDYLDPEVRAKTRTTIFLGFTSNLISSGVRESIRYLVRHKMVSAIVTTAGGVEEDFIKCLAPTYLGDFALAGRDLRLKGLNRIGNLIVPNDNYCKFEDWIMPILDKMLEEQKNDGVVWSPSKMIRRLGLEIAHPDSVYYWAAVNDIPVFSPALTDGSIGDMIYFHSYRNPGLVLDIASDIRRINDMAMSAKHSGMIILGGGVVKHHICNANLMRNGADHAVFINTGQEFDGSDSGARPDEAVSWGKIRLGARPAKIYADASLMFPLLVAETFAQMHDEAARAEGTCPPEVAALAGKPLVLPGSEEEEGKKE